MKRIMVFFICFMQYSFAQSQKVENKIIENLKSNYLTIEIDHGHVQLKTWDKSFIEIRSNISINENANNDKHDLVIQNQSSGITIKSVVKYDELERMVFTKDKDGRKNIQPLKGFTQTNNNGLNGEMEFGYDIEGSIQLYVPKDLNINLNSTYGNINISGSFLDLKAHSIYGLVEAKLQNFNSMKHLALRATYDIVDLTIDETSNANMNLSTTYGEIFTDLPIKFEEGKLSNQPNGQCKSGQYVLNKGVVDVNLVATYSNIYLRKTN